MPAKPLKSTASLQLGLGGLLSHACEEENSPRSLSGLCCWKMHFCGPWSTLHEVPLQHCQCERGDAHCAKAALRRVWIHSSTQVKTLKAKERGGWSVGLVQPGRALSWPQELPGAVLAALGRVLGCSSLYGHLLSSFAAKSVFPLHAM